MGQGREGKLWLICKKKKMKINLIIIKYNITNKAIEGEFQLAYLLAWLEWPVVLLLHLEYSNEYRERS